MAVKVKPLESDPNPEPVSPAPVKSPLALATSNGIAHELDNAPFALSPEERARCIAYLEKELQGDTKPNNVVKLEPTKSKQRKQVSPVPAAVREKEIALRAEIAALEEEHARLLKPVTNKEIRERAKKWSHNQDLTPELLLQGYRRGKAREVARKIKLLEGKISPASSPLTDEELSYAPLAPPTQPPIDNDHSKLFSWYEAYGGMGQYVLLENKDTYLKRRLSNVRVRSINGTSHTDLTQYIYTPATPTQGWYRTRRPPTVNGLLKYSRDHLIRAERSAQRMSRIEEIKSTICTRKREPINDPSYGDSVGGFVAWDIAYRQYAEAERLTRWLIAKSPEHGDPRAEADKIFEQLRGQLKPGAPDVPEGERYQSWLETHAKPDQYFFPEEGCQPRTQFEARCRAFAMHMSRVDWKSEKAIPLTHNVYHQLFHRKRPHVTSKPSFVLKGKPYGDWSRRKKMMLIRQANAESSYQYMKQLAAKFIPDKVTHDSKDPAWPYRGLLNRSSNDETDYTEDRLALRMTDTLLSEDRVRKIIREEITGLADLLLSEAHHCLENTVVRITENAVAAIKAAKTPAEPVQVSTPARNGSSNYYQGASGVYLPSGWFEGKPITA